MLRVTDTILHIAFYILLFAVPFLFTPWNYELFEFNKMLATYALAVVIVSAWAVKCILSGQLVFRRTFLDISLLLFLASQAVSTYFSIDRHTSIWGYYSRSHGGLLSTITYLLLYWAFVSNMGVEQVKTAIKYLLTSALIISIWGILEHFGLSPSCLVVSGELGVNCWVQDVQTRVFATLGQPNWLAAWIVAILPLTWSLLFKKSRLTLFYPYTLTLFLALLFTKSRSGLLGFGASLAVFWLLYFRTTMRGPKFTPRPFLLLVTCYLLLIAIVGTRWTPSFAELLHKTAPAQVTETTSPAETQLESGGTESGAIRKIVWKGALDIWRHYPIFGSGVETFAYSYYNFRPVEHNQTTEWDFLYNKAHNEYLNFAATTGTVGLGAYLILIGTFVVWSIKTMINAKWPMANENLAFSIWHLALLSGFISILVTNFFGFSVVNVATLFFLFPAMAQVVTGDKLKVTSLESRFSVRSIIVASFLLLVTCYLLLRLAQFWQADSLYARGITLSKNGQPREAAKLLSEALTLKPDEPNYYDALASSLSTLALDLSQSDKLRLSETKDSSAASETARLDSARLAQLAQEASDHAIEISPRNLSILKSRSTTFYKLSFVNDSYLLYSIEALERAIVLAPTDPKVHYNLGVLYTHVGEYKKAKELFEKTLQLKHDFEDAKTALQELKR